MLQINDWTYESVEDLLRSNINFIETSAAFDSKWFWSLIKSESNAMLFTVSSLSCLLQHHCRHCGNIFCAECSSKNALTPSSKKPVRVCEACYEELQGWPSPTSLPFQPAAPPASPPHTLHWLFQRRRETLPSSAGRGKRSGGAAGLWGQRSSLLWYAGWARGRDSVVQSSSEQCLGHFWGHLGFQKIKKGRGVKQQHYVFGPLSVLFKFEVLTGSFNRC